jgi:hypothetical protein
MRRILILFYTFLPSFAGSSGKKWVQDWCKIAEKRMLGKAQKARKHLPIHNDNNNSNKTGRFTPLLV